MAVRDANRSTRGLHIFACDTVTEDSPPMKKQDTGKGNVDNHNINVCVRIRPPAPRSTLNSTSVNVLSAEKLAVETTRNKSKSYHFSAIVEGSDQELAYNRIARPLLDDLRRGYSCTLCAYGQTGSGKTHSVFGPAGCLTVASVTQAEGGVPNEWGIFPRLVLDVLEMDSRSVIHASAIEIYQDAPYDLLADRAPLSVGTKRAGLKVGGKGPVAVHGNDRASNHCGTHPPGCSCRMCFEAITKLKAIHAANQDKNGTNNKFPQRTTRNKQQIDQFTTVGETLRRLETIEDVARFALLVEGTRTSIGHALNDRSSRSHCLINVHLSFHATAGDKKARRKLMFVDLAGSERIAKSGCVEGVARHQATSINGSLTVLGKVIRALSMSQRHIPYRDSTLTMLLRKSLDDTMASTTFVINVAPDHTEETICSLNFGQNLSKVKQRQESNERANEWISEETENELETLLGQLQVAKAKLAQAEARGQGEQFDPSAPEGEVQLLKKNLKRVEEEEAKVRVARFDLAELRALCKNGTEEDNKCGGPKRIALAKAKLGAREKELRNYQDIVARQMSIRGLYRPAKDVYRTCEREVRHLEAQIDMLRAQRRG